MHISTMSGKLDSFRALNSNTLTNPFCISMHNTTKDNIICKECYSVSMLQTHRKNCIPAFERNSYLATDKLNNFPLVGDKVFRIHGHGEIINYTHAVNILGFINANPNTIFGWWTKRKNIINQLSKRYNKPDNLVMIYSNPVVDKVIDPPSSSGWFDKSFNNVTDNKVEQNCTGQQCKDCLLCYSFNDVTKIVEKVK